MCWWSDCVTCPSKLTVSPASGRAELCYFVCLQVSDRAGLFDSGHTDDIQGAREGVCTLAGDSGKTTVISVLFSSLTLCCWWIFWFQLCEWKWNIQTKNCKFLLLEILKMSAASFLRHDRFKMNLCGSERVSVLPFNLRWSFIQLLIFLYSVVCTVMWMETKMFRGFISDQFNNPIAGINKSTDKLKLVVLYETSCLFWLNVLFLSRHSSVWTLWGGLDTKTRKHHDLS